MVLKIKYSHSQILVELTYHVDRVKHVSRDNCLLMFKNNASSNRWSSIFIYSDVYKMLVR